MGLGGPSPQNFNLYPKETKFLLNPLFISSPLTEKDPRRLREPQRACTGLPYKTEAHGKVQELGEPRFQSPCGNGHSSQGGTTGLCDFPAIHLMSRNRADRKRLEAGLGRASFLDMQPPQSCSTQKGTHSV